MKKKNLRLGMLVMLLVYGITIIEILASCASFGVYGSIDYIDDQIFIVNISVPPIAGGGSPSSNFREAMKYSAKEVIKQGGNYFIIFEGNYSEQLRDISFKNTQYTSRNNAITSNYGPQYVTSSSSNYVVTYALQDEEKEFIEWANKNGYKILSAKHILK